MIRPARRLRLRKETIAIVGTTGLANVQGGVGPRTTSRAPYNCGSDDGTYGCSTTGPWVTEYSCLSCNCFPP